jgi:hypothetical protein
MKAKVSVWRWLWLAPIGVAALTGCGSSGSSDSSGERPVLAAFNAVPDVAEITFLREEEVWSALEYGRATSFNSVDADQYDVNFDARLPGDEATTCEGDIDGDDIKDDDECTRLSSTSINVVNDHEYVMGMFGRFENVRVQVYDKPIHEFDIEETDEDGDPEDTNMEVQFLHWSGALGPVDIYLEPPGTNLSAVQVKAALDTGEEFHGLVEQGDYVLSLTPVAEPSAPLYTSESFTLSKQTRVAFAILEAGGDTTSSIKVSRFRDQGGDLFERRVTTQLRLGHVAVDAGNVDVFAQEDYSEPFVADLAYRELSDYSTVDPTVLADGLQLDITPAGNPGVLLAREQTRLSEGTRATFFLISPTSSTLDGLQVQDRFRRLAHYAEVRSINGTGASLDFYIIPSGDNVFSSTPTDTLSSGSSGSIVLKEPGSYQIVMARSGTDTFVFGPQNVELSATGSYTIVAVPTADAFQTDAVLLDDFTN